MALRSMNRPKSNSSSYLIAGMMLLVVGAAVLLIFAQLRPTTTVYLGNGVFNMRVAKTQSDREKGLSGVTSLGPREGMVLAYPNEGLWKIWMKDMKIPLDIVWLDSDKKVVHSVKNASPDGSTNVVFEPSSPAQYVIELPMGTIQSQNIRTGQAAVFDITLTEIQ